MWTSHAVEEESEYDLAEWVIRWHIPTSYRNNCLLILTGGFISRVGDTVTNKYLKILFYKFCLLEELLQILDGEFHHLIIVLLVESIVSKKRKPKAFRIRRVVVIINAAISWPQVCGHCNAVHVLSTDLLMWWHLWWHMLFLSSRYIQSFADDVLLFVPNSLVEVDHQLANYRKILLHSFSTDLSC